MRRSESFKNGRDRLSKLVRSLSHREDRASWRKTSIRSNASSSIDNTDSQSDSGQSTSTNSSRVSRARRKLVRSISLNGDYNYRAIYEDDDYMTIAERIEINREFQSEMQLLLDRLNVNAKTVYDEYKLNHGIVISSGSEYLHSDTQSEYSDGSLVEYNINDLELEYEMNFGNYFIVIFIICYPPVI